MSTVNEFVCQATQVLASTLETMPEWSNDKSRNRYALARFSPFQKLRRHFFRACGYDDQNASFFLSRVGSMQQPLPKSIGAATQSTAR